MQRAAASPLRGAEERPAISAGKPHRLLRILRGIVQFPYTFVAMNGAAVVGFIAFLQNRKDIWVRSSEMERWEGMAEPTVPMSAARSSHSVRKAA